MKAPLWVLREAVRALQERLLAEFGGLGGLRDSGLLGRERRSEVVLVSPLRAALEKLKSKNGPFRALLCDASNTQETIGIIGGNASSHGPDEVIRDQHETVAKSVARLECSFGGVPVHR